MKRIFFDYMREIMRDNPDVYFIMAGLGWPRVDEFLKEFPERAFNTEASEQTAMDICVGLAYAGKIPVVYTISPFFLRAFETIRTYLDHEKLHVIMVGAGRDDEYSLHDGFSHFEGDMHRFMGTLPNIKTAWPNDSVDMQACLNIAIKSSNPWYINVKKS